MTGVVAMGTVLESIGALGEALLPGRRRAPRTLAHAEARVASSGGDSAIMIIGNVSAHGCNVRGQADWLRLGSFVAVGIEGSVPLQAIVRWVRDGSAGLEFMRPVPSDNMAWREMLDSI
jgi:PilZ domain